MPCFVDLCNGSNVTSASNTGLNAFTNYKIYKLNLYLCRPTVAGSVNTIYSSSSKGLFYIYHQAYGSSGNPGYRNSSLTGTTTVFNECYDLEHVCIRHSYVTCIVSDFGKLQKLRRCDLHYNTPAATGSKTDLYNNGANCTEYYGIYN